jgi:hypothetical protein
MSLTTTLQSGTIWRTFSPPDSLPSQAFSNPTAQYYAQLNQICLEQTQAWLTEIGVSSEPTFTASQITSIWDVVNGCALTIDNRRLILIPSDQLDQDELRVPQEWVDIPAWIGDYYLAVQIDLETNILNIWGFISHRILREFGTYNALDRTYSIDSDFLISDLDSLSIAQLLELQEITTVPPLPSLALDQSQSLIGQLSQHSSYSPRLDIDFNTWAALLSNNNLREQLYQRRLQVAKIQSNSTPPLNLSNWLKQEFRQALIQGWGMADDIMRSPVDILRSADNIVCPNPSSVRAYSPGKPSSGVMDSLLSLLNGDITTVSNDTAQGEEYRSPEALHSEDNIVFSNDTIERAKLINLQYQLQETNVVMLIALQPQNTSDLVTVSVQIHAAPGTLTLPPQLKLSYITDEGEELQAVIARSQDSVILLPKFTCDVGTTFNLQLQLNGASQIEKFVA